MFPVRLNLMTCNLWSGHRWPARTAAVRQLLELFRPDVFCVQELTPAIARVVDRALPRHWHVEDDLPGWRRESNIWWSDELLEYRDHGAEDVGMFEPERRLFWVRLEPRAAPGRTLLVSTAHLAAPGRPPEMETGLSPRVGELKRIRAALGALVGSGEPAFFMGDMNDARHPQRLLGEAGFVSCFAALGLQSPPTFKAYPTVGAKPGEPSINEAIDLIVANRHARAIAASVPQCFCGDLAPSDHWPVQAIYEI